MVRYRKVLARPKREQVRRGRARYSAWRALTVGGGCRAVRKQVVGEQVELQVDLVLGTVELACVESVLDLVGQAGGVGSRKGD